MSLGSSWKTNSLFQSGCTENKRAILTWANYITNMHVEGNKKLNENKCSSVFCISITTFICIFLSVNTNSKHRPNLDKL